MTEEIGKLGPKKIFMLSLFTTEIQRARYSYTGKGKLHDVVVSLVDEPEKILLQTNHGAIIF